MKIRNNTIGKFVLLIICPIAIISGCQKIEHPALGNYPVDTNPPGGPLKFFTAMDGSNVDSIRANFGTDNDVSYASGGVSGDAAQFDGTQNGFISYSKPNDFGASISFTIAFWMSTTLAQKDSVHACGVLAVSSTSNFWSNAVVFVDHETSLSDSMQLKFHFANGTGDNWDFAGYTGSARWPSMYDGNWHHVAFVYDAPTKTATLYRDGVQFDQKTNEEIAFDGNSAQFIVGGFQEAAGIVSDYGSNTWMAGFPGMLDNIRLYGTALSASDVNQLFVNKQ